MLKRHVWGTWWKNWSETKLGSKIIGDRPGYFWRDYFKKFKEYFTALFKMSWRTLRKWAKSPKYIFMKMCQKSQKTKHWRHFDRVGVGIRRSIPQTNEFIIPLMLWSPWRVDVERELLLPVPSYIWIKVIKFLVGIDKKVIEQLEQREKIGRAHGGNSSRHLLAFSTTAYRCGSLIPFDGKTSIIAKFKSNDTLFAENTMTIEFSLGHSN